MSDTLEVQTDLNHIQNLIRQNYYLSLQLLVHEIPHPHLRLRYIAGSHKYLLLLNHLYAFLGHINYVTEKQTGHRFKYVIMHSSPPSLPNRVPGIPCMPL